MSERTYTLEEARVELRRQDCAKVGHVWQVVETGAGEPASVLCDRCGELWPVPVKVELA